ncbi:MAG: DNA-binding domain-containing protein, partial [Stellaceae bacterium]
MSTLLEIQRAVARSLLAPDDGAAPAYIVADGLAAEARLNIYRNTIIASLTAALRLSYPAVHRLVGA